MPLQLRQIIERVGAAQLAGVDQAHEQVAHLGAVQRLIKQRIFAMQEPPVSAPAHRYCYPAERWLGEEMQSAPSSAAPDT